MFLTILGTGFNLLYWLKFKRRSFQSFKIPPSGQPPQSFELLKIGSFKFPTQVPDFRSITPLPKKKCLNGEKKAWFMAFRL